MELWEPHDVAKLQNGNTSDFGGSFDFCWRFWVSGFLALLQAVQRTCKRVGDFFFWGKATKDGFPTPKKAMGPSTTVIPSKPPILCLIAAKSRLLQQSLLMVLCMPGVLDQLPSLASWLDPPADRLRFPGLKCMRVPSWELTYPGYPPKKGTFESMFFRTSQGGICDRSLEGTWWSQDIIPPISASEINLKNCRWIIHVQKIGCMERFDYLWRHIHLVSNFRVLEGKGLFCFHKTALFIMVISSRKNY